jgi:hypothetical protein
VNTVMNLLVPQNAGKFLNSCTTVGFSRRAQLHELSYIIMKTNMFQPQTAHFHRHPVVRTTLYNLS